MAGHGRLQKRFDHEGLHEALPEQALECATHPLSIAPWDPLGDAATGPFGQVRGRAKPPPCLLHVPPSAAARRRAHLHRMAPPTPEKRGRFPLTRPVATRLRAGNAPRRQAALRRRAEAREPCRRSAARHGSRPLERNPAAHAGVLPRINHQPAVDQHRVWPMIQEDSESGAMATITERSVRLHHLPIGRTSED